MGDRDRQHAVLALQRGDLVHEPAHRLQRGRKAADHAAVHQRHHRRDPSACGLQRELHHLLATRHEVGVRELLETDDQRRMVHSFAGHVAMRIELHADRYRRADDLAHTRQQITLAVVVSIGHHRPVQAQHHTVQRQRRAQLGQHFVTQCFVGGTRYQPGRFGPGARTFDQCPAFRSCAPPRHPQRRGAQRGLFRVLPGCGIKRLVETLQRRGDGRKSIGFGADGRRENAHAGSPDCWPLGRAAYFASPEKPGPKTRCKVTETPKPWHTFQRRGHGGKHVFI